MLLPSLLTLLGDFWRRGTFVLALDFPYGGMYAASALGSVLFWFIVALAAARRRGWIRHVVGVVFVVVLGLSQGVQGAFFQMYRTYDNVDADLYAESLWMPVVGSLPLRWSALWVWLALSHIVSLLILASARALVRPARRAARAASVAAVVLIIGLPFTPSSYRPVQASTPDMLYVGAVAASLGEQLGITDLVQERRPQVRSPIAVPKLSPRSARNVLFILQESQRFDVTCTQYEPNCQLATRSSNQVAPSRLPFLRWHALDSSTMLSCISLWTGLLPSDPLSDLRTAPTLFGFARAAGYDTAYFTSQHVIFKNMRLQTQSEPIDHVAFGTTLDLGADWDTGARDALLTEYVEQQLAALREPFFAVVHYSNQHSPYVMDPDQSPFRTPPNSSAFEVQLTRNKNVVYLSDIAVARLVTSLRASTVGARTVVLYTADHGESFGEHGGVGHTISLYESETHVPTWVDAPPGTLSPAERSYASDAKDAWLTHADFAPTVLDLMSVWDDPALVPYRRRMLGSSILRPRLPPPALPMTNNSWIWESTTRNWGYLRGPMKLLGTDGMSKYACFDVQADPGEVHDLGEAACGDLGPLTRALFPSPSDARRPYRPLR